MINAVFNHRNFWDMRAQNEFNGVNPFGARDPNAVLYSTATEAAKADLVAFLEALTDDRVRIAAAPFDHPQIFVPNGHPGGPGSVTQRDGRAVDTLLNIPATGRNGGPALPGFLEDG